jgi:hypothetical protein
MSFLAIIPAWWEYKPKFQVASLDDANFIIGQVLVESHCDRATAYGLSKQRWQGPPSQK